jgi:hypothetical protein
VGTDRLRRFFRRLVGVAGDADLGHASDDGTDGWGRLRPVARKAPINYIAVFGMLISPIVVLLTIDGGSTAFVLTAIALALIIAGPLLVSNRLAEPNYDVILGWDPERLPPGWEAAQRKYYTYNWIRAFATWVAFGLLLAALVEAL